MQTRYSALTILLCFSSIPFVTMSDPDTHFEALLSPVDTSVQSIAGYVAGEYSCSYNNVNGTLYAGSNALHFSGSYYLFDKKVTLDWQDIRKVEKLEHGIQVLCHETAYVFAGIQAPDRVWALLVSLHNDSLMGRPGRRQSSIIGPRNILKRRNSDPLLSSKIHTFDPTLREEEVKESGGSGDDTNEAENVPAEALAMAPSRRSPTESFVLSTAGLDVSSIEQVAGKLSLQPIQCVYNNVKGKLYVGKGAIYFYGKKFFWDYQEILLRWEVIRGLKMIDAKTRDDGAVSVGIRVVTKDDEDFRFLDMDNADQVWTSLVAIHNENLLARSEERRSNTETRRGVRRMNSDPNLASMADLDLADLDIDDDVSERIAPQDPQRPRDSAASTKEQEAEVVEEKWDDETDWSELADKSYKSQIVEEHELNCNLDKFEELFLQDEAEFSISKFLESRGDSNLQESSWADDGVVNKTRIVSYTHPVNAPMAPPQADARKKQKKRRYGEHGLCVWTETYVDDVPMTDCFFVSDRIRVLPKGDGKVTVFMEFELVFVKSTMFKAIITKTTTTEFTGFFEAMANHMSEALGDEVDVPRKEPVAAIEPQPSTLSVSGTLRSAIRDVLLLAVLLTQVWIVMELKGLKSAVNDLRSDRAGDPMDVVPSSLAFD